MDDISFSKRRKNRGYTYLCAGSVICVSLLRAPQYSTFACCLIPVLTLVVLLVMLDDIDGIFFSKRKYFLIVSWMSISVYCTPTRDTHITRDMCMGIHICDPPQDFNTKGESTRTTRFHFKTKEFILTRFSTLAILPH